MMGIWDDYAARVQLALGPALNRTDRWGRYLAEDEVDEWMAMRQGTEGRHEGRDPKVLSLVYDPATPPAARTLEHDPVRDQPRVIPVRGMRGGRGPGGRPQSDPFAPVPVPPWWPKPGTAPEPEFKRPPPPEFLRSPGEVEGLRQGEATGGIAGGLFGAEISEMVPWGRKSSKTKSRTGTRKGYYDDCEEIFRDEMNRCANKYGRVWGYDHFSYNGCKDNAAERRQQCKDGVAPGKRLEPWGDGHVDGSGTIHEKKPSPPQRRSKTYKFGSDDD